MSGRRSEAYVQLLIRNTYAVFFGRKVGVYGEILRNRTVQTVLLWGYTKAQKCICVFVYPVLIGFQFSDCFGDVSHLRQDGVLELGRIGHERVQRANAFDRSIEILE